MRKRESVKLKKMEYLQNQLRAEKPEALEAVIIDVRSFGLIVELPGLLLTGMAHVSSLQDDFYSFEPARMHFVGAPQAQGLPRGRPAQVLVERVNLRKQQVDFMPAPAARKV